MLFNSLDFILFFLAVYGLYLCLPFRAQNRMLLAASYLFYGCWDWRFLGLIWLSSTLDFFAAQAIRDGDDERTRRSWLALSVAVNLGILFVFKYYGFFADSLQGLAAQFGLPLDAPTLHVVLPVGISFYTFQTMSYTLDVYRRQMEPTRRYFDYLLFVSYFPQLVAGPIERAGHLLGQLERPRTITYAWIREGLWLILLGYYKKVVLADNLAPFANEVFNAPGAVQGLGVLAGLLAFCFQIYGDFAGYSDIARGLGRLMGVDLMFNFRMPYFAVNPSDFWRRWHISLSTWLRDYLYIPLGGNRRGPVRTYVNLSLTMLLGGLWHGASWHFVAWGAYQGLLLIAYRLLEIRWPGLGRPEGGRKWAAGAVFFMLTCLGWALFRVNSLGDLGVLCRSLWVPKMSGLLCFASIAGFVWPLLIVEAAQEKAGDMMAIKRWPAGWRLAAYLYLWAAILLFGAVETQQFIYFQF